MEHDRVKLVGGSLRSLTIPSKTVSVKNNQLGVGQNGLGVGRGDAWVPLPLRGLYNFDYHMFTAAGASGRTGPSLTQCRNAYAGVDWVDDTSLFKVEGGIQYWTVPITGMYRIEVCGAQGGAGMTGSGLRTGGLGAKMAGDFQLEEGDTLLLLVGQRGGDGDYERSDHNSAAGGGGTFVAIGSSPGNSSPLIIAGGGGGMDNSSRSARNGQHGLNSTKGGDSSPSGFGRGGSGGAAGSLNDTKGGEPGAGFYGNSSHSNYTKSPGPRAFRYGGLGGQTI